jgi:hypothetical protein
LSTLAASRAPPHALVARAKLVLWRSNTAIAERLGWSGDAGCARVGEGIDRDRRRLCGAYREEEHGDELFKKTLFIPKTMRRHTKRLGPPRTPGLAFRQAQPGIREAISGLLL